MNKRTIRLTESQLHNLIKESVKKVLRESSDSVSPQPFGRAEDAYSTASDEDEARHRAFRAKYYPWDNWPDAQTLEGLITIAYHLRSDFDSGKYSYNHLISDLYDKINQ
ncbi:MAG: hypothetical protein HUK06_04190 [Bacteroidaceae bacterium]|nr:hypothetical protein [Bacteroidaceae bacterium]